MRRISKRPRRGTLTVVATILGAASGGTSRLDGQEVPLDRWLVTGARPGEASDMAGRTFPDRDTEDGLGYWTLLREDGQARADLSEGSASGPLALAHAYVRADRDAFVRLAVTAEPCAETALWLNGQRLDRLDRDVRLAAGWNTVLLELRAESTCPRAVRATLSPELDPVSERELEAGPPGLRVQASRPPGVRPNHPDGLVALEGPRVGGLRWVAGEADLVGSVDYALVAWGRGAGSPGSADRDRPGDRTGGGTSGAGTDDGDVGDTGPTDPDGLLARMIGQLEDPGPRRSPAPGNGSVEIRLAGERIVSAASGLVVGRPEPQRGSVPFRKLRDAALRDRGVEARIRWSDGEREVRGALRAADVLRAFHGKIVLDGLASAGDGSSTGQFRVPDALAGFALGTGDGRWWVDGAEATDGVLCAPCDRGRQLEIRWEPGGSDGPTVKVSDPGYPAAGDRGPPAIEWLRALEGDNRRYRELAGS